MCIEMTLCKGLAVKGRLKIVKLELGSRVEGRLFLGEEDMGNTWGEEEGRRHTGGRVNIEEGEDQLLEKGPG